MEFEKNWRLFENCTGVHSDFPMSSSESTEQAEFVKRTANQIAQSQYEAETSSKRQPIKSRDLNMRLRVRRRTALFSPRGSQSNCSDCQTAV